YFHLIESQGASFFSFVNYLNPVFGVIWGAFLLAEVISFQALVALGAILLGIGIANWRGRSG
ncbi:MAG: EamA family transporter, partial [Rhodospirillaceae bacterium]|nr:EamA family transporter [Rhodospirillaceae bacterium]